VHFNGLKTRGGKNGGWRKLLIGARQEAGEARLQGLTAGEGAEVQKGIRSMGKRERVKKERGKLL